MRSTTEIGRAMKRFFKEIGVPPRIVCDGARDQVKGETRRLCDQASCNIVELERGTPASNRAEHYIGMLKTEVKRDMATSGAPLIFWCYCLERRTKIINATPRDNILLDG